jgi:hypothetical protein
MKTSRSYTYEFKSDSLFVEIKIALDAFAAPLTQITNQLVGTLPQQKDKKVLEQLFTLLEEAMSIFYSLNYQGVCTATNPHWVVMEESTLFLLSRVEFTQRYADYLFSPMQTCPSISRTTWICGWASSTRS